MKIRALVALAALGSSVLPHASASASASVAPASPSPGYQFAVLPSLPGSPSTVPHGINGKGQVVGESAEAGSGTPHAIFWPLAGGLRDLGANGRAFAINDDGLVVGNLGTAPGYWKAGIWHRVADFGDNMAVNAKGVMAGDDDTNLAMFTTQGEQLLGGLPQAFRDTAQGIDLARDVVGVSYMMVGWGLPPELPHLHREGRQTQQLPIPGNNGAASAINDAGVIVGTSWYIDTSGTQAWSCAVRWDQLQPRCLDWSTAFAGASALDAQGDIVGWGRAGDGRSHAVLWRATGPVDLNDWMPARWRDAGWVLTSANAINDGGWIAGELVDPEGHTHAWLLRTGATATH